MKTNTLAPNFILPSTSKVNYSLKDSLGKYVVIYFYPKDDTPGCTIETIDFIVNTCSLLPSVYWLNRSIESILILTLK